MSLKEFFEARKENKLINFFGEGNYATTNNRFALKNHLINDDEIIIVTRNVSFFRKLNQYVLWVSNEKVVYLKDWQVMSVYNHEKLGDCYLVKLNRKYFKSYNCFVNNDLFIDKEETFEDLVEIAKKQNNSETLFFKEN